MDFVCPNCQHHLHLKLEPVLEQEVTETEEPKVKRGRGRPRTVDTYPEGATLEEKKKAYNDRYQTRVRLALKTFREKNPNLRKN